VINRELIYSTLWQVASNSAGYVTKSRRLLHYADLTSAQQPAICMSEKEQDSETKQNAFNAPVVWTLRADFFIYVNSGSDPRAAPAILLNPLIDALEGALAPDPVSGIQDLGLPEMVQWVRIHGKIETAEGVLGAQELAIVPVEIRCI